MAEPLNLDPVETDTKAESDVLVKNKSESESEKLYKQSIESFRNALDIEPPGTTFMARLHLNLLITILILFSYFLGRFRFSLTILFGFMYIVTFVFSRRYKKFKTSIKTLIYRSVKREETKNSYESVEWLNHIISRVWHVLEPEVCKEVFRAVNPILQEKCPPFLSQLKLTTFTLGSNPPFISGVAFIDDCSQNLIQFDCEICFVPLEVGHDTFSFITKSKRYQWNSKIVLIARLGTKVKNVGLDLPVLVKGISFKGLCRITVKLVQDISLVDIVDFRFMEVPQIDFDLVPLKTVDLMDVPGLSSWIHSIIKLSLKNATVNPNSIIIDLKKKEEKPYISGILYVFIREIRFKEKESVKIEIGVDGRRMFHTRKLDGEKCLVGEYFYIIIGNMDDILDVKVITMQSLGKENFGEGCVDIKKIKHMRDHIENVRIMKKGNVRSVATLHLHYAPLEKSLLKDKSEKMEKKEKKVVEIEAENEEIIIKKMKKKMVVKMKVIGIEDLKSKNADNKKIHDSYFSILASPRIEESRTIKEPNNPLSFVTGTVNATAFMVGGALSRTGNAIGIIQSDDKNNLLPSSDATFFVHESKVIAETNSPLFNEEFEFIVRDRRIDFIYIRVNDKKDGNIIGKLDIPINELKVGEETYRLKECQSGKIKIITDIFYTKLNEEEEQFKEYEKAVRMSIEGLISMYDDGIFYCLVKNQERVYITEPFCIGDFFFEKELIFPIIGEIIHIQVYKSNEKQDDYIGECEININDFKEAVLDPVKNNENYSKGNLIDNYRNGNNNGSKKNIDQNISNHNNKIDSKIVYENDLNLEHTPNTKKSEGVKRIPLIHREDENGTLLIKCDWLKLMDYKGTGEAADNFKIVQVKFNSFSNAKEEFYIEFKKNEEIIKKSMRSEDKNIENVFTFLVGKSEIRATICGGKLGAGEKLGIVKKLGDCLIPKRQMKEQVMLDENKLSANIEINVKGCNYKIMEKFRTGKLEIFIRSAKGVPKTDSNGKSDPYIKLFINGSRIHKTDKIKGTVNPVYNEKIDIFIDKTTDILRIELFDWNQFENNKLTAFREIPLIFVQEKLVDINIKLIDAKTFKKTAGDLLLGFRFGKEDEKDKKIKSIIKKE